MRPFASFVTLLGAFAAPSMLASQEVRVLPRAGVDRQIIISRSGADGPMIGVTTFAGSDRADTLGLRVESVRKDSPAEKAGLKEGDRLQAVNGVSLRADRADAGEDDYAGVLNRRLQREVQRTRPGEAVELRVLTAGQVRTVRVIPVKASELADESPWRRASSERTVLGLTARGTGTVRDTLGVFVQSVASGGPAEKAGIVEGDRIAAINGVSLRVAPEDAEDHEIGAARAERLSREVSKLKAGESVELTVVTAGRARTVRVTTVKAGDLPDGGGEAFFFSLPMQRHLRGVPELPLRERMELPLPASGVFKVQPRIRTPERVMPALRVRREIRTAI